MCDKGTSFAVSSGPFKILYKTNIYRPPIHRLSIHRAPIHIPPIDPISIYHLYINHLFIFHIPIIHRPYIHWHLFLLYHYYFLPLLLVFQIRSYFTSHSHFRQQSNWIHQLIASVTKSTHKLFLPVSSSCHFFKDRHKLTWKNTNGSGIIKAKLTLYRYYFIAHHQYFFNLRRTTWIRQSVLQNMSLCVIHDNSALF